MNSRDDPWHDARVSAQNRCPSCGGFLYAGNACPLCQSDAAGSVDDFDFFAPSDGPSELALELERISTLPKPSTLDVAPASSALAASRVPNVAARMSTPPATIRPPSAPVRTDRTSSRPHAGPDAIEAYARFGAPHASPALHFVYFVRAWSRRQRLAEKAALLRRMARAIEVDLESRHALLGQAIFDEPSELKRHPELLPHVEAVRAASLALADVVTTKEGIAARAARAKDLAASRLERAAAAWGPIEQVELEARKALADADHTLSNETEALALIEGGFRAAVNEGRTDADTLGPLERELETQKARVEVARRAQREAALKASDARRRVLVEASRVAEAEGAVDDAQRAGRAELRAQERKEHDAADRFRKACAELGRAGYALGAGQTLKGTFWDAKKTRDAYDGVVRHAETASRARDVYDAEAYVRGRNETLGIAACALAICLALIAL